MWSTYICVTFGCWTHLFCPNKFLKGNTKADTWRSNSSHPDLGMGIIWTNVRQTHTERSPFHLFLKMTPIYRQMDRVLSSIAWIQLPPGNSGQLAHLETCCRYTKSLRQIPSLANSEGWKGSKPQWNLTCQLSMSSLSLPHSFSFRFSNFLGEDKFF